MRIFARTLLLLATLRALPLHAAWAKVPIIEIPERIYGTTIGRLQGKQTLVLSNGRRLVLIRWGGEQWTFQELDSRSGALLDIGGGKRMNPSDNLGVLRAVADHKERSKSEPRSGIMARRAPLAILAGRGDKVDRLYYGLPEK